MKLIFERFIVSTPSGACVIYTIYVLNAHMKVADVHVYAYIIYNHSYIHKEQWCMSSDCQEIAGHAPRVLLCVPQYVCMHN